MKRRDFLKLGAAATAAGALGTTSTLAQTKMVLKATDVHPLGYPTVEAVERIVREAEQIIRSRLDKALVA